jgi:ABC-type transport system involved in multi-copper enzyme maturation permease subunit
MYAWKWWRESRKRIISYLIMLLVATAVSPWLSLWDYPHATGGILGAGIVEMWRIALTGFGSFVVVLAGLNLGASGVGEEFAQGTVEFLLTRPRRRRYFVWASWAIGAATLFIMIALAILGSFATFVYVTKSAQYWKFLTMIVPLFVLGTLVFGLTYFMTAVRRSTRNGLTSSLGLILIGLLLPAAVQLQWRINLPTPLDMLDASMWATIPGTHFPVAATAGWSLVALAFPLATQFLFERAEV